MIFSTEALEGILDDDVPRLHYQLAGRYLKEFVPFVTPGYAPHMNQTWTGVAVVDA